MRRIWFILGFVSVLRVSAPGFDFSSVTAGLSYAYFTETNHPWSIHIARIERSHKELQIISTHAGGHVAALGSVADQTRSVTAMGFDPLVAVNGDFFVIASGPYQGDPGGLQIMHGDLLSLPHGPSLWSDRGNLHLSEVRSKMAVIWPDGGRSRLGLNEAPRPDSVVLFTPSFGPATRATNFAEVLLEAKSDRLAANHSYNAIISEVNSNGNTPLKKGRMVLSVGAAEAGHLASASNHAAVRFETTLSDNLREATEGIGGGPILVRRGKEQRWNSPDKKDATGSLLRHPRTAIGFNRKYLFLVVVDGRQPGLSIGMNFPELAAFMKSLDCEEAMNLDGGGSSTFWLQGKIKNSPSDKRERAVANAVVIVRRLAR